MEDNKEFIAIEIDGITGKHSSRVLTSEEIADRESVAIENAAMQQEAEAKIHARTSAVAKLAALGLTEEEIAAL
jgi:hypothetical protein